jgi:hypothetical protein
MAQGRRGEGGAVRLDGDVQDLREKPIEERRETKTKVKENIRRMSPSEHNVKQVHNDEGRPRGEA